MQVSVSVMGVGGDTCEDHIFHRNICSRRDELKRLEYLFCVACLSCNTTLKQFYQFMLNNAPTQPDISSKSVSCSHNVGEFSRVELNKKKNGKYQKLRGRYILTLVILVWFKCQNRWILNSQ